MTYIVDIFIDTYAWLVYLLGVVINRFILVELVISHLLLHEVTVMKLINLIIEILRFSLENFRKTMILLIFIVDGAILPLLEQFKKEPDEKRDFVYMTKLIFYIICIWIVMSIFIFWFDRNYDLENETKKSYVKEDAVLVYQLIFLSFSESEVIIKLASMMARSRLILFDHYITSLR